MDRILDHICLNVGDYRRARAFYDAALAPLGIKMMAEYGAFGGYGRAKPELWVTANQMDFQKPEHVKNITPVHVCFGARSRQEVDAFYQAAIKAGAKDNGKPGIREHYHPNYYGAFVIDPDGHNIEAVFHG